MDRYDDLVTVQNRVTRLAPSVQAQSCRPSKHVVVVVRVLIPAIGLQFEAPMLLSVQKCTAGACASSACFAIRLLTKTLCVLLYELHQQVLPCCDKQHGTEACTCTCHVRCKLESHTGEK